MYGGDAPVVHHQSRPDGWGKIGDVVGDFVPPQFPSDDAVHFGDESVPEIPVAQIWESDDAVHFDDESVIVPEATVVGEQLD